MSTSTALMPADVFAEACVACRGECLASCFNDAIEFRSGEGYQVVENNCAGCGACIPACGSGFIFLDRGIARIAS
jgi:Fe-S-cluster-containing hydrogenase component 2